MVQGPYSAPVNVLIVGLALTVLVAGSVVTVMVAPVVVFVYQTWSRRRSAPTPYFTQY
jgi:hypothetical protein